MGCCKDAAVSFALKCCDLPKFCLCLLAILLSPLAVLISDAECSTKVGINVVLFLLGVLPGILHAWYVILGKKTFQRLMWSFLAIILPPLPVAIKYGCQQTLLINILLTLLGFLPGIIHAWYSLWVKQSVRTATPFLAKIAINVQ